MTTAEELKQVLELLNGRCPIDPCAPVSIQVHVHIGQNPDNEKENEMTERCPNCGYCPTCGQSRPCRPQIPAAPRMDQITCIDRITNTSDRIDTNLQEKCECSNES